VDVRILIRHGESDILPSERHKNIVSSYGDQERSEEEEQSASERGREEV